jgi:hypothetical protein
MKKGLFILLALLVVGCTAPKAIVRELPEPVSHQEILVEAIADTARIQTTCITPKGDIVVGGGSGVYLQNWRGRQEVVTAAHVMAPRPAGYLCVWTIEDEVIRLDEYDQKNDLALVSFESDTIRDVGISNLGLRQDNDYLGSPLFIVGYPWIMDEPELRVTHGRLQSYWKDNRWTTNAEAWFGNSGGPVFDYNGDLVGILIQIRAPSLLFTDYIFVPSKYIKGMLLP